MTVIYPEKYTIELTPEQAETLRQALLRAEIYYDGQIDDFKNDAKHCEKLTQRREKIADLLDIILDQCNAQKRYV